MSAAPKKRLTPEEEAFVRGARETALSFTDLVDDCDRAIQALAGSESDPTVRAGMESALARMLDHLARQGLHSISPLDEQFDPLFHEAIAVEPGDGKDGVVVRVHRRGWLLDETLIRPAIVTVCQGSPAEVSASEEELAAYRLEEEAQTVVEGKRPRRRQSGGTIPGFTEDQQ